MGAICSLRLKRGTSGNENCRCNPILACLLRRTENLPALHPRGTTLGTIVTTTDVCTTRRSALAENAATVSVQHRQDQSTLLGRKSDNILPSQPLRDSAKPLKPNPCWLLLRIHQTNFTLPCGLSNGSVSYTHLRAPRDLSTSRMPSSA